SALLLDGGFARPEVGGDLLVEQTGDNPGHHVPLARRQRGVASAERRELLPLLTGGAIAFDGLANRIEQILLAKRLREELDRPGLHGPDRHGDVAVAGEEDDRQGRVGAGELSLQVEAAQPREAHVEDKTSRRIDSGPLQECLSAREDLDRQAHGGEEPPERVADGGVVIDDEDNGSRRAHATPGSATWKVASRPRSRLPRIGPPAPR